MEQLEQTKQPKILTKDEAFAIARSRGYRQNDEMKKAKATFSAWFDSKKNKDKALCGIKLLEKGGRGRSGKYIDIQEN